MKSSTKDRVKGRMSEAKGKVKEKIGKAKRDLEMRDQGTAEKAGGKIQRKVGELKKGFREIVRGQRSSSNQTTVLALCVDSGGMVFDVCAATGGRSTRVAITIAKNSKAAPRYHGAPGRFQPRSFVDEERKRESEKSRPDNQRDCAQTADCTLEFALFRLAHSPRHHPICRGAGDCPDHHGNGKQIACACVTKLKARFDESFVISNPVVAAPDGLSLLPYNGLVLTMGGELNKLALERRARPRHRRSALAL
jgi:uncharacterized protein YjbJ (UPF0337 family)